MMKRVMVACNTLTSIDAEAHMDQVNLAYRLGRDFPEVDFFQFQARRMAIDRFRNQAASFSLEMGCDYLLFIDDDMRFHDPKTIFHQLLSGMGKYGVVAALNYIRGYPFDVMAFKWTDDSKCGLRFVTDEEVEAAQGQIIEVGAIGTAVCLIDVNIFKKLPTPWFVTGNRNTEDIYFCCSISEHMPEVKIGVHCGAITGHLLDKECISYFTKKHLLEYHRSFMTEEEREADLNKSQDRGMAYVRNIVEPALKNT